MAILRVVEIFASLQGEGYWSGVPMTFVRLAGCNAPDLGLECARWCDTPASWSTDQGEELQVQAFLDNVGLPRLCLTGGEPLLQANGVAELIVEAGRRGIKVHVETNGTVDPMPILESARDRAAARLGSEPGLRPGFDWAVVSPKPPGFVMAPGWEGLVDELKLIADEHLDAATAERVAAAHPGAFISVQPQYQGTQPSPESIERALALVMQHPEWRLSLQTHKHLGIR